TACRDGLTADKNGIAAPEPRRPDHARPLRDHADDARDAPAQARPGARRTHPKILAAGICAPNGANLQTWRFLVVKDEAIKRQVQVYYKRAFDEVMGPQYRTSPPPPGVTKEAYLRQMAAVEYLTDHFHEAPVWIVACLDHGKGTPNRGSGASIYPAVQNMLLTARALGLGPTLTTRHRRS